ncbi:hypothetical protein DFH28DRAFT_824121, partial [Melampsora americana]
APDYDEDKENNKDKNFEMEDPIQLGTSSGNKYHTIHSRKLANRLNSLISKANFISRRVARSTVWRCHFARIAKGMNLKVLPLTPGYNVTRWNTEFDSLNRLVQARKVVNKLLADDLDLIKSKKRRKGSQKPRGYFHDIFLAPDDWSALEELTAELATNPNVTQPQPDPTAQSGQLNQAGPANLFQLFKAEEPEVEANEIASYLKGTHPMSVKDNARQTKAVLPWWR